MPQLPETKRRLDVALAGGLLPFGTRFLYTINGAGKCYEATLHEMSQEGHVRLDDSGVWQWPPEVHVEEVLPPRAVKVEAPEPGSEAAPAAAPSRPQSSSTPPPPAPSVDQNLNRPKRSR